MERHLRLSAEWRRANLKIDVLIVVNEGLKSRCKLFVKFLLKVLNFRTS